MAQTCTLWNGLSHNHKDNKGQEIEGMSIDVNAIITSVNISMCTSIKAIQTATCEDVHFQEIKAYIAQGWPYKEEEVAQGIRQYWPIRNEVAMIDDIMMKCMKE